MKIDEPITSLTNFEGTLWITKDSHVHLNGKNKIEGLTCEENNQITIELEDDASLIWIVHTTHFPQNVTIIILENNHTKLDLSWYLELEENTKLNLENKLLGNENESHLQIHAVNVKASTCQIKSTGYIKKDTQDNQFEEELKGLILYPNTMIFLPELIVDSNKINAKHNATMKCIDEEEIFYLASKGISRETSIELIKNGFLNKTQN